MGEKQMHTKGPWSVGGILKDTGDIQICDPTGKLVIGYATNAASFAEMLNGAMRRGRFDSDDAHTQTANAALIAAAPSLLAALRDAAPHVCSLVCPSTGRTEDGPIPHSDLCKSITEALALASPHGKE